MKTIVPELSRQQTQELVAQQRKEYRLLGSKKRIPGLILFEYDVTTGELIRASLKKEVELMIDGRVMKNTRVDTRDMCLYIQALNEENALRKVKQLLRRKNVTEQLLKPQKNG